MPQMVIETSLDIPHNSFKWSAVVATLSVAALVGALLCGRYIDAWGRRAFMRYNSLTFVVGGVLELLGGVTYEHSPAGAYAALLLGRAVAGVGAGGATVVVPLYLGEVAHSQVKGTFAAMNQLTITAFILVAQALGLDMSTPTLWGWMLAMTTLLGCVGFGASYAMVESPRWLVSTGQRPEAERLLRSPSCARPSSAPRSCASSCCRWRSSCQASTPCFSTLHPSTRTRTSLTPTTARSPPAL